MNQPHSPYTAGSAGRAAASAPSSSQVPGAADLPLKSPYMPADRGLTGLGILMSLGGSVLLALWIPAAVIALVLSLASPGNLLLSAFLGLTAVRAHLLGRAGRGLLYGHHKGALAPLRKYIRLAWVHTGLTAVFMLWAADGAVVLALALTAACAVWPSIMHLLVMRAPIARTREALGIDSDQHSPDDMDLGSDPWRPRYQLPLPVDNGYESLAVLTLVMGLFGLAALLAMIGLSVSALSQSLSDTFYSANPFGSGPFIVFVLLMAVRSVVHLRAGIAGLRGASTPEFERHAMSYANLGGYTALFAAGVLFFMLFRLGGTSVDILLFPLGIAWALAVWPRLVGSFVRERSLTELTSASGPRYRAPDKGLTSLGWLLLGTGWLGAAGALIQLWSLPWSMTSMLLLISMLVYGTQVWAGYELSRMGVRYQLAGRIYAAVGILAASIASWQMVTGVADLSWRGLFSGDGAIGFFLIASMGASFVLPLVTWILLRRDHRGPLPAARVRVPAPGDIS